MSTENPTYQPLARKYRSQNFDELIGQDALVQTLQNAIEHNRLHHAYIFTGIRGTGKTSTARLLARAVNYVGTNNNNKPTTGPTDDCPFCQAIAEDRHPDVLEIDAASHRGVDDIKEIMDGVKYAPTSARYKVYIIDEVHMLSTTAFNALLKTLEEPPKNVIFILATTEIHKVPVTILSRCQRFDLRRIGVDTLSEHYKMIAAKENVKIDDDALNMIARAADGSVRDGLSLLDQAIGLSGTNNISASLVEQMLGKADRSLIFECFGALMKGESAAFFKHLDTLYESGADPKMVLHELLDVNHLITRIKADPNLLTNERLSPIEKEHGQNFAGHLSIPVLTRIWQVLMKGIEELRYAPDTQKALEVVLIRGLYLADLPPMTELVETLKKKELNSQSIAPVQDTSKPPSEMVAENTPKTETAHVIAQPAPVPEQSNQKATVVSPQAPAQPQPVRTSGTATAQARIQEDVLDDPLMEKWARIVNIFKENNEIGVFQNLYMHARPVEIKDNVAIIALGDRAPEKLLLKANRYLSEWDNASYTIEATAKSDSDTLLEFKKKQEAQEKQEIMAHPIIKKATELLPSFEITDIQRIDNQGDTTDENR